MLVRVPLPPPPAGPKASWLKSTTPPRGKSSSLRTAATRRNYPENSIPAIESVIRMGVDIMELDLKLTKDSVLVLCHDHTIDRTTSGKGRVRDITYDSIRRCKLRRAHNVVTDSLRMPTLREALKVCKDRIVVNIDQGYEYYDLVLAVTEELGVTEQILIKGKRAPEIVAAKFAEHPRNMMYMPIIDILKPKGRPSSPNTAKKASCRWPTKFAGTARHPRSKPACGKSSPEVRNSGSTRFGHRSAAGLDDDRAFEGDPAAVYGKLVDMGATMIQTDRPELLISYLRSRGLHD